MLRRTCGFYFSHSSFSDLSSCGRAAKATQSRSYNENNVSTIPIQRYREPTFPQTSSVTESRSAVVQAIIGTTWRMSESGRFEPRGSEWTLTRCANSCKRSLDSWARAWVRHVCFAFSPHTAAWNFLSWNPRTWYWVTQEGQNRPCTWYRNVSRDGEKCLLSATCTSKNGSNHASGFNLNLKAKNPTQLFKNPLRTRLVFKKPGCYVIAVRSEKVLNRSRFCVGPHTRNGVPGRMCQEAENTRRTQFFFWDCIKNKKFEFSHSR